ncbi:hypothetical protein ADUPG1_007788 [Aduncisulcus paluster]|uniref:TPX2 C-terminal domain-containing protein n=1 Tax=Aduncisulcus paluster TaxID=2918883 RepID=A0ABQ5KPJ9_9EUKA|nr:hypothetical protein ADUPG1_007788 [Aduncisulcus paluster]
MPQEDTYQFKARPMPNFDRNTLPPKKMFFTTSFKDFKFSLPDRMEDRKLFEKRTKILQKRKNKEKKRLEEEKIMRELEELKKYREKYGFHPNKLNRKMLEMPLFVPTLGQTPMTIPKSPKLSGCGWSKTLKLDQSMKPKSGKIIEESEKVVIIGSRKRKERPSSGVRLISPKHRLFSQSPKQVENIFLSSNYLSPEVLKRVKQLKLERRRIKKRGAKGSEKLSGESETYGRRRRRKERRGRL